VQQGEQQRGQIFAALAGELDAAQQELAQALATLGEQDQIAVTAVQANLLRSQNRLQTALTRVGQAGDRNCAPARRQVGDRRCAPPRRAVAAPAAEPAAPAEAPDEPKPEKPAKKIIN
jgi:hypothetical protein